MPEIDIQQFTEAFQLRRDHCQALLFLSQQQQAAIAKADYSELLSVLARKQQVLDGMNALKAHHAVLWGQWKVQRELLSPAERERCEAILGQIEALLAEVIATEDSSTQMLSRQRDETQQQLEAVVAGAQAHDAYHQADDAAAPRRLNVNL